MHGSLYLDNLTINETCSTRPEKDTHITTIKIINPNYKDDQFLVARTIKLSSGQPIANSDAWLEHIEKKPYEALLLKKTFEGEMWVEVSITHGQEADLASKLMAKLLETAVNTVLDTLSFGIDMDDINEDLEFGGKRKDRPIAYGIFCIRVLDHGGIEVRQVADYSVNSITNNGSTEIKLGLKAPTEINKVHRNMDRGAFAGYETRPLLNAKQDNGEISLRLKAN